MTTQASAHPGTVYLCAFMYLLGLWCRGGVYNERSRQTCFLRHALWYKQLYLSRVVLHACIFSQPSLWVEGWMEEGMKLVLLIYCAVLWAPVTELGLFMPTDSFNSIIMLWIKYHRLLLQVEKHLLQKWSSFQRTMPAWVRKACVIKSSTCSGVCSSALPGDVLAQSAGRINISVSPTRVAADRLDPQETLAVQEPQWVFIPSFLMALGQESYVTAGF